MSSQSLTTWPRVSLVILNWNGAADTIECLTSLEKIDYPNSQIVVVDNGSTDDSVPTIRRQFPTVTVLPEPENLGFAGGSNRGIEHALATGCDYVLLLNNDTVVAPDFLTRLVEVGERYPEIGMLSPLMYYYQSETHLRINKVFFQALQQEGVPKEIIERLKLLKYQKFVSEQNFLLASQAQIGAEQTTEYTPIFLKHLHSAQIWCCGGTIDWNTGKADLVGDEQRLPIFAGNAQIREADYLIGCAQLAKRAVIEQIGLLDARFFAYYEDIDWSVRCQKAGWKTVVAPASHIWHKVASTAPAYQGYIWQHRNMILFLWKHSNLLQFPIRFRRALAMCVKKFRKYRDSNLGDAVMHGLWSAVTFRFGKEYRTMPKWLLAWLDRHTK